ncbi:MAG: hypothetical protein ACKPKO_41235, partial [Candidatus Fonsibacter sp.]
ERGCLVRSERFCGGNLAVVRYCAREGRLLNTEVQTLLDQALADVLAKGWTLEWTAVRRRRNGEADRLATAGVLQVALMVEELRMDTTATWTHA